MTPIYENMDTRKTTAGGVEFETSTWTAIPENIATWALIITTGAMRMQIKPTAKELRALAAMLEDLANCAATASTEATTKSGV